MLATGEKQWYDKQVSFARADGSKERGRERLFDAPQTLTT